MYAYRFSPEQTDISFGFDFISDVRAHSLANFICLGDAYFDELISGFVVRRILRNEINFELLARELGIIAGENKLIKSAYGVTLIKHYSMLISNNVIERWQLKLKIEGSI